MEGWERRALSYTQVFPFCLLLSCSTTENMETTLLLYCKGNTTAEVSIGMSFQFPLNFQNFWAPNGKKIQ